MFIIRSKDNNIVFIKTGLIYVSNINALIDSSIEPSPCLIV